MAKNSLKVGIIMGSQSDQAVMEEAAKVLKEFGVPFEMTVASAHRTPEKVFDYCKNAAKKFSLIIAGAGAAAHLPGVVAANTPLPVIGVPIYTKVLEGIDSFLSILQMPSGVPVATMAINAARNAGLLAVQMLSISEPKLRTKFKKFKKNLAQK